MNTRDDLQRILNEAYNTFTRTHAGAYTRPSSYKTVVDTSPGFSPGEVVREAQVIAVHCDDRPQQPIDPNEP